jgi:hypothetical protein
MMKKFIEIEEPSQQQQCRNKQRKKEKDGQ